MLSSPAKIIGARSGAEIERQSQRTAAEDLRARIAAAREVVRGSVEAHNFFEWTAGHAQSAIERVHAGLISDDWGRQIETDRALVTALEHELEAL